MTVVNDTSAITALLQAQRNALLGNFRLSGEVKAVAFRNADEL